MKQDLPPYWTTQLAAIIIVFSVGAALFPIAHIANGYWWEYTQNWEPRYTYSGGFEANLTAASPMANVSVGFCDTIEVSDEYWYGAEPVTLQVYNDTHWLFAIIPTFGGEPTWRPAAADLHFTMVQNYTVQVEREARDTLFRCDIHAYEDMPPPPMAPSFTILIFSFGIGILLINIGIALTINFVRRTRSFFWMT